MKDKNNRKEKQKMATLCPISLIALFVWKECELKRKRSKRSEGWFEKVVLFVFTVRSSTGVVLFLP